VIAQAVLLLGAMAFSTQVISVSGPNCAIAVVTLGLVLERMSGLKIRLFDSGFLLVFCK